MPVTDVANISVAPSPSSVFSLVGGMFHSDVLRIALTTLVNTVSALFSSSSCCYFRRDCYCSFGFICTCIHLRFNAQA